MFLSCNRDPCLCRIQPQALSVTPMGLGKRGEPAYMNLELWLQLFPRGIQSSVSDLGVSCLLTASRKQLQGSLLACKPGKLPGPAQYLPGLFGLLIFKLQLAKFFRPFEIISLIHFLPNLITELNCRNCVIILFTYFQTLPWRDLLDSLLCWPWLWRNKRETDSLDKINFFYQKRSLIGV